METFYISTTETAKMMREALKRHFPAVKFSVVSKKYSGGSSINVAWNDGPSSAKVDKIAQRFAGAWFDGMDDSTHYEKDLLMDKDGNVRQVQFGAKFVFCNRHVTPGLDAAIQAELRRRFTPDSWQREYDLERAAWRGLLAIDIPEGEAVDVSAERAAEAYINGDANRV